MACDYLVSSLPPIAFDGPLPFSPEEFAARFLEQCGKPLVLPPQWIDLESQIRNAIAAERARIRGIDGSKYVMAANGCSVYWRNRAVQAMQEKDALKRDAAIDRVFWDAAGELTAHSSPLGEGAAYTYAIRLAIAKKRSAISTDEGNKVFNRLTAASSPEAVLQGK